MNTKDLKLHFFRVLTHAENIRCEDISHKKSTFHKVGENCKEVQELQQSVGIVRDFLKSVGLNGI